MLIHVRLLQYASKTFTYSVPEKFQETIAKGMLIKVPLMNRVIPAVVEQIADSSESFAFAIKPILDVYPFPQDSQYVKFLATMGQYYQVDSIQFLRRIQKFLEEKEKKVLIPEFNQIQDDVQAMMLTDEQQRAYEIVSEYVQQQRHQAFVLHGVTGSGKTEVYKQLITDVLAQSKSAMIMLPEVTLALRFEKIFSQYFTNVPVVSFHSAVSIKQKRLLWKLLLEKKPVIIIGVHLPILLPISNLGLIIVDEEHDAGYQEKKHPKLHSRDMAVLKASMYGVPLVLGSATPSLTTLWNVQKRGWKLLRLTKRFAGNFPTIEIVSLKKDIKRKHFWITNELYEEIQNRLVKKEQTIVFLNRRGHSFFVQCPCSFVFSCDQCSVSLTLHSDNMLVCHYCGYKELLKKNCPECNMYHDHFLKKGVGTQQLVQILHKLFPQATIARADADTTVKKLTWQQILQDMLSGDIDILVGTQSITKGYHFPGVTLVGVLWADLNLHFPMYNAAETTLQQLIQVAGRAGRQSTESKVIVQTFDEHEIYKFVSEQQYLDFYKKEVQKRIDAGYPPYKHVAEIEMRYKNKSVLEQEAMHVVGQLRFGVSDEDIQVLGPVAAIVYKIKGYYSQKIIVKSFSRPSMMQMFAAIDQKKLKSTLSFTIDLVA